MHAAPEAPHAVDVDLLPAIERTARFAIPVLFVLGILAGALLKWTNILDIPGGDPLISMLSPDSETSLATWFTVLLLATTALAAGTAGRTDAALDNRRAWFVLAALLLAASVEEIAAVHEHIANFIGFELGVSLFVWVIPGAVLGLAILTLFWRLSRTLPTAVRQLVVGGLVVYLMGVVGIEALTSLVYEPGRASDPTLAYAFATSVEECVEMVGVLLVLRGILLHLASTGAGVRVLGPQRITA